MITGTERGQGGMGIQGLFRLAEEMGRRRVWRTALAYGAVAFVLLQLGEILFPAFGAPDWSLRVLVVGCFLGFPLVLCLSWVFDITGGGIRVTRRSEDAEAGEAPGALPRLALLAVTLAAIGGTGWWTVRDSIRGNPAEAASSPTGTSIPASVEENAPRVHSLAVLPLDDFSETEGDAYFTAGLHEELISQLSRSSSARVLSRTTVAQYDRTGKTMPAIAQELGVDGVVEGSVFRSGDRVRITVQLIHGPSDTHLWADSYEGTTEDAIALQREVAQAIAGAIEAELFGDSKEMERPRLASGSKAEEEYMKGRYEQFKGTPEGLESALNHFRKAVSADSSFAAAHAGIAGTRYLLQVQASTSEDGADILEDSVLQSLETALNLDETSPEAQAVLINIRNAREELLSRHIPRPVQMVLDSGTVLDPSVAQEAAEFGGLIARIGVHPGEIDAWQAEGKPLGREQQLAELEASRKAGEKVSPVALARASVALGREAEAYRYLEEALARKDRSLLTLWTDPVWDDLRGDTRFREILSTVRALRGRTPNPRP